MYLLYPANTATGYAICLIPIDQTAAEKATSIGLTMAECAEFDMDDFDSGAEKFQYCFTLIDNQPLPNGAALPLLGVQEQATVVTKSNYSLSEQIALSGYSAESLAAQAALPEASRVPAIQAVITEVNSLAVQLNADLLAIQSATTVSQIYNIAYPAPVIFNVTTNGTIGYSINAELNPLLILTRGETYTFNMNAFGQPFWIKTSQTTGTNDQYNIGVTNNGEDAGTITFTVAIDAPDTLYYNSQYNDLMTGVIDIID